MSLKDRDREEITDTYRLPSIYHDYDMPLHPHAYDMPSDLVSTISSHAPKTVTFM